MKTVHSPLFRKTWSILDQSNTGLAMNPMQSFAYDDTLCRLVANEDDIGIARTWVHDKTIVLGIQDSRLPHVQDGIKFLKEHGYEVIVRNSGGLAVVLDPGVLNISLLFKDGKDMSIDRGYELMVELMKGLLSEFKEDIVDGEIAESYCPGRYDLSVHGQKFAGISQRRIRGGVAVQIYLAVSGSGSDRAELIRKFYDHAVQGVPTKYTYPQIIPEKMASISEITGRKYTVNELTHQLLLTLQSLSEKLDTFQVKNEHWKIYEENYERMLKRNEKLITD
ncbi:lipoate--protein ligase family protein [Bacillus shivajii]|uniref:lipoate--protein ligase family protein n=1 Tax=Bacillus shivajii TaxID=1983719 RepID=UPI001CFA1645|nr:lipoate--protein ligase family protein [Bacillus shivajii]UCZ53074.1 lipoate--protein ligase family protein [Bacillus shivajii]